MIGLRASILVVLAAGCASNGDSQRVRLYLIPKALPSAAEGEVPEGAVVARVEIASTPTARHRGLQGREALDPDCGMLFMYPESRRLRFWMQETRIPLSICYADGAGRIIRILDMDPPPPDAGEPRFYPSGEPALFALEMERGWFTRHGITLDDRLEFHPAIQAITPR
jgi:uncharacterized membrane protein (UPF0127 family)